MAGGLVGLLDDIATLAKAAAASIDDIGVAAGKASVKAAGLAVDDAAVTPAYVHGLAAEREIPIIKRIAIGSIRNKLLLILPAALVLSEIAPILVEIILMCGGTYLAYEGAHKIHHKLTHRNVDHADKAELAVTFGPEQEERTIKGAVRTDLILSAEIMVIALKEVIDEGFVSRAAILAVVAAIMTVVVYGAVALLVKMDDAGLRLAQSSNGRTQRLGRGMVAAMPKVLSLLQVVGTAAMLWVGGHILVVGAHELGWHGPEDLVHWLSDPVHGWSGVGGVLAWLVETAASAVVGLVVGMVVVLIVAALPKRGDAPTSGPEHA